MDIKKLLDFLKELKLNNNRDWFESNKARYIEIKQYSEELAEQIVAGLSFHDPSIKGLTYKDCTYRIYRDVRFSKNKEPYKTHIGLYICPQGKKSGYGGYYLHLEPRVSDNDSGPFMSTGVYMPENYLLNSIREDIESYGKEFLNTIEAAKGFNMDTSNSLKKLPRGFAADTPYAEYIKLRDVYLVRSLSEDELCSGENLAEFICGEFRKTVPFNNFLNRAVTYAYEEREGING